MTRKKEREVQPVKMFFANLMGGNGYSNCFFNSPQKFSNRECAHRNDTQKICIFIQRPLIQWWAKWRLSTFDLYIHLKGGAWGEGTNMWHPETPASYESLPAPLATQILTLLIHTSEGRGRGGALILDRCRAFDLFASVDAHLCKKQYVFSQFLLV